MDGKPDTILIVDDEGDILDLLEYNLRSEGFDILRAGDGVEASSVAQAEVPDLMILDVMMPRMDGIQFCRYVRQHGTLRNVPIIMLTAKDSEDDFVAGLDVGADIYLSKPISVPVIISQVRALLRSFRRAATPPDVLVIHDLEIDRDRYLVFRVSNGEREELRFPRKEFLLLHHLAAHPGKVFTRQQLLDVVWGSDVYVVDRTVDVHIRKIREKLGTEYIETTKGVGYRFAENEPIA